MAAYKRLFRLVGVDSKIEGPINFWKKRLTVENKAIVLFKSWAVSTIAKELNLLQQDFKKSVIDMAYSLIERGFVKKTPQYEEAKKQQATNGSG